MRSLRYCATVLTLATGMSLSACGSSNPTTGTAAAAAPNPAPAQSLRTPSAPSTSVSDTDSEPPSTQAPIPSGTYRVRITRQDAVDAGSYDGQWAGTWTLTLDRGHYQLHCARVENDSQQCGNSGDLGADLGMVVEVGTTAGDASTLWLSYDQASTSAVNGCPSCSPTNRQLAPYRLNWSLAGHDLVLTNLWASTGFNKDMPEINNYTLKPWKKIG